MRLIKLFNVDQNYAYHNTPGVCPICHHHIVAIPINAIKVNERTVEILFQCNNQSCLHGFIVTYGGVPIHLSGSHASEQEITKISPKNVKPININDDIEAISPTFYKVYLQALEAEAQGLDEIAGVGLRKALEFLVKDYCVKENPSEEDAIKTRPLMQVINAYMTEAPKVKSCATKAVWLGNDETHYVRKWEDKDIKDLKLLIALTLHHIESELMMAEFEADMG